jgi:4-hydroxy-tetrahydrodipicolinate reductase
MIKVFVVGALGRMGRAVWEAIGEEPEVEWAGGLDHTPEPGLQVVDRVEELPEGVEVVIDFSSPQALPAYLPACIRRKVPVVLGTTGLQSEHEQVVKAASAFIPILYSPNLSVGVNVMFSVARDLVAKLGPAYDVEIVEIHHNRKKDAPSGTARRLLQIVQHQRPDNEVVVGRHGDVGARDPKEIGVHSVRAGDVVGEHRLILAGNHEVIELVHRAESRACLARGALIAARWLAKKKPGIYGMADALG